MESPGVYLLGWSQKEIISQMLNLYTDDLYVQPSCGGLCLDPPGESCRQPLTLFATLHLFTVIFSINNTV